MTNTEPPVAPPAPPVPSAAQGEVPLSAPYYGASLGVAFTRFWRKYATFSGRASRSEYWWWALVGVIVSIVINIIGSLAGGIYSTDPSAAPLTPGPGYGIYTTLSVLWFLAAVVPTLALVWRRLHDTNRSGGFYFFLLIPLVGWIFVLVFLLSGPKPEGARFDK
jgi:uncharacterized membrane protein YhaH (DUF805 family)